MTDYYTTSSNETLSGSAGDDRYFFNINNFGQDSITTTAGQDSLVLQGITSNLTINLNAAAANKVIDGSGNSIRWSTSFSDISDGDGNDLIYGSGNADLVANWYSTVGNDTMYMGDGNDSVGDGLGNDSIFTEAGDDSIYVREGNDYYNGGSGTEEYRVDVAGWGNDTIDDTGGNTLNFYDFVTGNLTVNLNSGAGAEVTNGTDTIQILNNCINYFRAWDGNDLLYGTSGNEYIAGDNNGSSSNDTIIGGAGDDDLNGDLGNDSIIFADGWGGDTLATGAGIDTLDMSAVTTNLTINLAVAEYATGVTTSTSDSIRFYDSTGGGATETVLAGSGNDVITGSTSANSIHAGNGNDTIDAGSGNDTMDGGAGSNTYKFTGVIGTESISGDSGTGTVDFSLYGLAITANLTSSGGNEVSDMFGSVNWASDIIENVTGSTSGDIISGSSGDNTLNGYLGNDTMNGGSGNNTYVFNEFGWGSDSISGDTGTGTLNFTALTITAVTVNLTSGAGNEAADGLSTLNFASNIIENVVGGSTGDSITGNTGSNSITGGAGNDSMNGLDGNDTFLFANGWGSDTITADIGYTYMDFRSATANLTVNLTSGAGNEVSDGTNTVNYASDMMENFDSGSGNDLISGTTIGDYISGGSGNDSIYGLGGADTYIFDANWGQDTLNDSAGSYDYIDLTTLSSSLTVNLTSGGGHEVTDGTNTINWSTGSFEGIATSSTHDVISGTAASETIYSHAGNDTIIAGDGNNFIDCGDGDDSIVTGSGNDELQVQGYGNKTIDSGAGNENIYWGGFCNLNITDASGTEGLFWYNATTLTVNLTSGAGYEANDGTNTASWTGDAIENFYNDNGDGINLVYGSSNDNLLQAGGNNDTIFGNAGSDTIYANSGNDSLVGGAGDDELYGQDGNDTYNFANSFGIDYIEDTPGELDNIIFGAVTSNLTLNLNVGGGVTDGINSVSWNADTDFEYVTSGKGHDLLTANISNNIIWGSDGNDTTDGDIGNDTYKYANNWGNDSILDGGGTDTLMFTGVTSMLTINLTYNAGGHEVSGDGTLNWGSGVTIEKVFGGNNADTITGNNSANYIDGGIGDDTMDGGIGNDTYAFTGTWGSDSITDSVGVMDAINLSAITSAMTINLTSGAGHEVTNGTSTINWASDAIEQITAGTAGDLITGNSSANRINGGNGNDTMDGAGGNDTYVFVGNWGADSVSDSSGTADSLDLSGITTNLTVNLTSSGGHEVSNGSNTINFGSSEIEKIYTGSGADSITGNTSNNFISAGSGNDTMDGGSGNDTYVFSNSWGTDSIIDSAGTADALSLSSVTSNLTINLNTGAGHEVTDGTNTINWSGSVFESIISGSGNDNINASNSTSDYIHAGNGANTVSFNLSDTIYSGTGDDYFTVVISYNNTSSVVDAGGDDSFYWGYADPWGDVYTSFSAIDTNSDTYLDSLRMTTSFDGEQGFLIIRNYFDNTQTSATAAALTGHAGSGLIETITVEDDYSPVDYDYSLMLSTWF